MSESERVGEVRAFLTRRGHDLSSRDDAWMTLLVRALGDRLKTLMDAERYGSFALDPTLAMDPGAWSGLLAKPHAGERLDRLAARLSAVEPFALDTLESATRECATALGIKAGELIGLARIALTGKTVSPGIFEVMALLGRSATLDRICAAADRWRSESALAKV